MLRSLIIKFTPLVFLQHVENILLRSYGMSKNLLAYSNPNLLELLSERKALAMLYKVEREVPAYRRFLAQRKIHLGDIYSIKEELSNFSKQLAGFRRLILTMD